MKLYLECGCGMPEHILTFEKWYNDGEFIGDDFVAVGKYLSHYLPWYKRIIVAVKYVLKWGKMKDHFDTTELSKQDVSRLIQFLQDMKDE